MALVAGEDQLLVLDEEGRPTGELLQTAEVHARGLWHAAIHAWLLRDDGQVLLSRAAPGALPEPLKLAPTAVLHAAIGDEAEQASLALERLLGAVVRATDLRRVGTFKVDRTYRGAATNEGPAIASPLAANGGPFVDREHVQVFAAVDRRPLHEYVLDPRRVDNLYEVPLDRAVGLFETGSYVPAPGFDSMRRVNNALLVEDDLPSQGRDVLLAELRELFTLTRPDRG